MKFLSCLALLTVTSGRILSSEISKDSNSDQENVINVKIGQILPRHQCRRALRNLQVLLSELTRHLHQVSGGSDLVSLYRVELPSSWRNTECTLEISTREGRTASTDLLVTGNHPLLGASPYPDQFGSCGVRGRRVVLPFSVLTETTQLGERELNSSLLEVYRWRYGVFSETGLHADAMYPRNVTRGPETVRNEGCSEEDLRSNGGLCPVSSYYSGADTKQNLLCGETSARKTILNRFLNTDPVKFEKARVEYVVPSDTERVILLLEQSALMADKWSSVLSSTFQFINSLSEGIELAVVTFGRSATVQLEPTRVVGGNREGLHYRIPRRIATEANRRTACLVCGLVTSSELATNTTTLIILSSSVTHKNNTELMKFEASANTIITRRIVFGKLDQQQPSTLDSSSRPVFMINQDQDFLNVTSDVSQALAASLPDHTVPSKKFHLQSLPTRDTEGSFWVEPSLSTDLWIQLLLEDTTDVNVFEIKSPSGQIFSFPKFDAGLVYFSLRGPRETGVWSYRIRFYSSAQASGHMILECWGSGGAGQINLQSWSQSSEQAGKPVHIYAKLDQAGLPVINAEVFAVVEKPGSGEPVRIELVDNGSGYPDITRGDGIYSAYFTSYAEKPGFYTVIVEASNNSTAGVINTRKVDNNSTVSCCGSSLPTEPLIPLESFHRFSMSHSFHLDSVAEFYVSAGAIQRRDTVPPNRITDFRLANYFNNSLFVTLAWSAPGDDYTLGRAFRYEIRCFTTRKALSQANFDEQGILVHSTLVPAPEEQGVEQRCTVGVPWPEEVFYYAIVAFDSAGNHGEVSNIISVYVNEPVTTTVIESTTMSLDMKDVSKTLPLKSFIHSESLMYIIAGIISFILIVIVIILTVIIRRLGVCSKKSSPSSSTDPTAVAGETPSLPDLCHEQSYMRNSISYMSGYDLPEMLEYTLRSSSQKAAAQELTNNNVHRLCDQYLVVNSTKVSGSLPTAEVFSASRYYTASHKSPSPVIAASASQHSPSISPVNSTFTVGQSTDCSVSVSGSDHEMVGDTLQVVTPGHQVQTEYLGRPEPKPRKIPPAVPSKTVHASLV